LVISLAVDKSVRALPAREKLHNSLSPIPYEAVHVVLHGFIRATFRADFCLVVKTGNSSGVCPWCVVVRDEPFATGTNVLCLCSHYLSPVSRYVRNNSLTCRIMQQFAETAHCVTSMCSGPVGLAQPLSFRYIPSASLPGFYYSRNNEVVPRQERNSAGLSL
jgi:hypothetical protein